MGYSSRRSQRVGVDSVGADSVRRERARGRAGARRDGRLGERGSLAVWSLGAEPAAGANFRMPYRARGPVPDRPRTERGHRI
jgi:hypothetical protein